MIKRTNQTSAFNSKKKAVKKAEFGKKTTKKSLSTKGKGCCGKKK
ncbi:hypothetical protein AB3N04_16905 [Alkalihalophilus sp. As8PL]|uniref:Uncharacterized protein n=1 Tax=Alkalihalophilus sp. As8PL TaxID=3237103 RepID=A0AB39BRD6_9BACI